jgi:hypothetical protein
MNISFMNILAFSAATTVGVFAIAGIFMAFEKLFEKKAP